MNHYLSRRGYISLYLILFISIAIVINFIIFILNLVGISAPQGALVIIKALVLFVIPIICIYKFLLIEKRPPTMGENYFISAFSFLPVLFLMLIKTLLTIGAATQNKAVDFESFAAQSLLNLVILSGVSCVMLLLSYGTLANFWNRSLSQS